MASDRPINDVLLQKAQAAKRAEEARVMSPAKALRRALSRTANDEWELMLTAQGVLIEELDQDGAAAALTGAGLLVLLDGPDGAVGGVLLDRELLAGLIEVQTIGRVTKLPADTRELTHTDAAMMTPLIDGCLKRFVTNLEGHPMAAGAQGFRFGVMMTDVRSLSLLLDAAEYSVFRVTLDLADGTRQGEMVLVLPAVPTPEEVSEPDPDAAGEYEEKLLLVPATVRAELAAVRVPVSRLSALKPGDVIELPEGAIRTARLVAGAGHVVAKVQLGRMDSMRAVRLLSETGAARANAVATALSIETPEVTDLPDTGAAPVAASALADSLPAHVPALPETQGSSVDAFGNDLDALPDLPPLDFDEDEDAGALIQGQAVG